MKDIMKKIRQLANFIAHDIWRIRRSQLSAGKSFLIKQARVLILSLKGFHEDKCQLRASALTFYALISIVPVAAMAFGIAKGFGLKEALETQLRSRLAGQEEIAANIIAFSHSLLEKTQGGLIAGVGLVVLMWAVFKLLGQIESSFNDIWKIKEKRSIGRMFGDYLALIIICPVLLILSSSTTVFITTQVSVILEKFTVLGCFSSFIFFLLKLLPYMLMWFLFTFLYIFIPNARVRFSSGLVAGIIAGTIFQIVQWAYITFQIGVVHYNTIYGSFAALPLFLVWLQLSWTIVLYGAEVSVAYQNADIYEFEPDFLQASHRMRILLSLLVTSRVIKNFIRGEKPMTALDISSQLGIPIRFVNEILFDLIKSRIFSVVEIEGEDRRGHQPAIDVSGLTIQDVMDALETRGMNTLPLSDQDGLKSLADSMDAFFRKIETLPENRCLKDI